MNLQLGSKLIRALSKKLKAIGEISLAEPENTSLDNCYSYGDLKTTLAKVLYPFRPIVTCPDLEGNSVSSSVSYPSQSRLSSYTHVSPVCDDMTYQLRDYAVACDRISSPVANSMKRLSYLMVPYINSSKAETLQKWKQLLPSVGLLSHHNPGPRDFLVEALNGMANVEVISHEMLLSEGWHYDNYTPLKRLEELVARELEAFDFSTVPNCPGPDWFRNHVSYQVQLEMSFSNLLKKKRWQMLIAGDTTSALSLAAFDTPRAERPPLVYFGHGSPYGYPMVSMFTKADWLWVRGPRDREYFGRLGYPDERIVSVGCPDNEGVIPLASLNKKRIETREALGIGPDDKVILYAVSWDSYLYKTLSAEQILAVVTKALHCVAHQFIKSDSSKSNKPSRIWLFLKYHPYPTSEPAFEMSRFQYPLDRFLPLRDNGYEIRLTKDLSTGLIVADCFLSHESTTLTEAIQHGVPTVSLDYCQATGEPTLGAGTYKISRSHRFISIHETAEAIGDNINDLLRASPIDSYRDCLLAWSNIYDFGRTEGLMRIISESKRLLQNTSFEELK